MLISPMRLRYFLCRHIALCRAVTRRISPTFLHHFTFIFLDMYSRITYLHHEFFKIFIKSQLLKMFSDCFMRFYMILHRDEILACNDIIRKIIVFGQSL